MMQVKIFQQSRKMYRGWWDRVVVYPVKHLLHQCKDHTRIWVPGPAPHLQEVCFADDKVGLQVSLSLSSFVLSPPLSISLWSIKTEKKKKKNKMEKDYFQE